MLIKPFNPSAGTGVSVTTAVASAATAINPNDKVIRIFNNHATVSSHVRLGNSNNGTVTITATTADLLIGPGQVQYLYKNDQDRIAYLRSGASDGSLFFSTGSDGTN